jgi:hypothetical protein
VVGSEDAFTVGEDLLFEGDGFAGPSRRPIAFSEVVAGGEGVGVVGAQAIGLGEKVWPWLPQRHPIRWHWVIYRSQHTQDLRRATGGEGVGCVEVDAVLVGWGGAHSSS